jgi:putative ABC transport system permease protein
MSLWQDLRYGARTLRKAPGFTLTAVVTMALGIGATTANFSICDAMLWKPLPLPHLDQLVMVMQRLPDDPHDWVPNTPADAEDIRRESTSFQDMAFWEGGSANIVGAAGEPERVKGYQVSANFFDVLGVNAARGRVFQPGDDQPGRQHEVVIGNGLWRRRFGADPEILGKPIRLDNDDYTVVGVLPEKSEFPITAELWTPLALDSEEMHSRTRRQLDAMGRLKPGRTAAQAAAEIDAIAARLARQYPDTNKNRRFVALPARQFLIGPYTGQYVLMLFGAVLFVLLIACANVANLQFARATGRTREVALRTALGAGRGRLVAQLLTESVLLCLLGAALGLLVASWGLDLNRAGMPPEVEKHVLGFKDISLNGRALAFTLAAAVLSGILAGLAPAWQGSRTNVNEALKEGGRGGGAPSEPGRGKHRLRAILVAAEIALAVVLLVGAGLMVRGFQTLAASGARYEPATMLTLELEISDNKYRESYQQAAFYRQVLERTSAIPGVRSAVAASSMPYNGQPPWRVFTIEGKPPEPGNLPSGAYQSVSVNYFETMHIPLLAGRLLSASDGAQTFRAAVISERMARRWWPGEALPVGRRIQIGVPEEAGRWLTIVGVVGNAPQSVFNREPVCMVYVPYVQAPRTGMDIGVRAWPEGHPDPTRLAPAVTAAIRSVDPEQPITLVATLEALRRDEALGIDYVAVWMGVFGLLALALSSIGVYGVMAYLVSEQTRDIGIRMALGAPRENVLGMIFRRGMMTAAAGLAAGLAAAYALARLMASLVWGVTSTDPATFLGIAVALGAAAALAIYIPARRAMLIDPIVALRYE